MTLAQYYQRLVDDRDALRESMRNPITGVGGSEDRLTREETNYYRGAVDAINGQIRFLESIREAWEE